MTLRYARLYNDGSFNVSSEVEDYQRAKQLLSDSRDDDDVELVQVEISVVQSFGKPKLQVVEPPGLLDAMQGLIGLVELVIPTLDGSQKDAVANNHRLIAARAAVAAATGGK